MKIAESLVRFGLVSFCALAVGISPAKAVQGISLVSSFTFVSGSIPFAALTAAGGHIYYGSTVADADYGYGGVYQFVSSTEAITLLDSFDTSKGTITFATLIPAGGDIFLGTAYGGGDYDLGTVFSFNSNTGSISLQGSFDGLNGSNPYAPLIPAGGGLYYGTTYGGGSHDKGGVFSFDSNTSSINLVASFTGTNGGNPLAGLTDAGGGLYYGTTGHGGDHGLGSIFAFDSTTGTISLLNSFDGSNGAIPHAPLTAAGGGLYYGTTRFGGSGGFGSVFEFNSNTGAITLQDSFTGPNGSAPFAALTPAGGDLYFSTTNTGGDNDLGTVFAFNSSTGKITLMDSFTGANGAKPLSALIAGDGGLFYGTTVQGGANNIGAIYVFNPVPGPLPLLGVGATLGWSQRLRRRLRGSQAAVEPPMVVSKRF